MAACGQNHFVSNSQKNDNGLAKFFVSILGTTFILDYQYNYVYVNEQAARTAGFTLKDLVGTKIWDTFPELIGSIFEKNVKHAMEKREIRRFEWLDVYANRLLEFTVAPLDEGLLISCEERAEDTLEGNEDKYRYLIKHAPVGICEINYSEFYFKSVNETLCNILGYRAEELLSMNILDVLDNQDKTRFQERIKQGVAGEKLDDSTEYKFVTKDGRGLWVILDMKLTYDDGKMDSVLIVAHDISERRQMQAKLEEYSKNLEILVDERTRQLKDKERLAAIGETAAMVGHDIRNPLQAMISDVYLLKSGLTTTPDCETKEGVAESLDDIEKNIEYVNKIVADLQDYARQLSPEYNDVDLSGLIGSIFKTINIPDAIKLSIDIKAFPKLKTDPTFIRRALTNLVNNAIQAMPDGGKLELVGFEKGDEVYITVSDSGVGIPHEVKPKLFTPMVTTKAKGQGLGLAVVKRLIGALNGTITFESQEGKGTKFLIKLPRNIKS